MDNADLGKLKLAPGKLAPKFKAGVTEYSVIVASTIAEVKLSPLTSDSGASYVIKGAVEKIVQLTEGQTHTVEILVTAEDGKATKTYTLLIRRLSADDASLSQLELSAGALKPAFSPLLTDYECYLPSSIDSISIRAKTEDEAMRLSMSDGSPLRTTLPLNAGRTLLQLSVASVSGNTSTLYSVKVVKNRLPVTLQLKSSSDKYECAVCCAVVACPSRIKDGPYVYCHTCLEELTRTNKMDPFTGKKLGEEQWFIEDIQLDNALTKEMGVCPLSSGKVEASLGTIGARLLSERMKGAQTEEATTGCPDCSKKVPTETMAVHKEKLCSAKHTHKIPKQEIKMKPWEKSLVDDSLGADVKSLLRKAEELELQYLQSLPKPGRTQHWPEGSGPLDYLLGAARCYASALKSSPRETKAHLGLGLVMEELFLAQDLYGLKRDESGLPDEGEAERSSKEEEFLAICGLHGVSLSSPLPLQLKALEAEYHSLKEAGQTHKAEHVQSLHAWKSKKILEESAGSYSVDSESPLYRAKVKLQDAVSSDTSNPLSCYHLGRLCLLLGESEVAITLLMSALSLKPTHSESRYCLGLALSTSNHSNQLLLHGLSEYLRQGQEVNESQPNPSRLTLKELNAKTLYRASNPLIMEGFLSLARLGGGGHLSTTHCLLAVTPCVALASLQCRGSTFEKLLWASLQARSDLLTRLHSEGAESVLRHCQQLSGLVSSTSSLSNTPQVRDLQMKVFELGVVLQPSSSEALCYLGNGQLTQYDTTNDAIWLDEAEISFRASIAMEGKTISPTHVPDDLKSSQWWKKMQKTTPTTQKTTPIAQKTTSAQIKPPTKQAAAVQRKPVTKATSAKTTVRGAPVARKPVTGSKTTQAKAVSKTTPNKPLPASVGGTRATPSPATPTPSTPSPATPTPSTPSPATVGTPPQSGVVNKRSHVPRLGLARTLSKSSHEDKRKEAQSLYREVMTMAPHTHDAYIELGEMLVKTRPLDAVHVYSQYPFSQPPTFDDAYLHGEVSRLLMSAEAYDDPRLVSSMVAMGQALGIGVLEKQVAVLENKFKSALLKKIYAGVHRKPLNDPDLQAFFKFKCWL